FKTSRFPRSFPPLGIHDTVIAIGDQIVSVHGSGIFFEDQEIVKVSAVVAKETTDSWLTICFSESGKAIVQQQSIRGCTAAAAAMLFLNYGKRPDYQKLRRCNLGTFKTQEEE